MRWTDRPDADLLEATRSNADAFAVFYDRYEAAVLGYMLRRTGNVEVAVDLTSEVFAAALGAAHRYRPDHEAAAAWLFTIARNLFVDSARRGRVETRARRQIGIRDAIEYSEDKLDRIEMLAGQSNWVGELLAALSEDQRDAIRARVIDERSYPEIAQQMRTSELVVRKRVSRGLATLRDHLEDST